MSSPVPLRRKLLWLIGGRAAIVTLLFASGEAMQLAWPEALPPIDTGALAWLVIATYGLTVFYGLLLASGRAEAWLTDLQLAVDAVVVSVIVGLTGGIHSYFASLYSLPIIIASIIKSRRGGLVVCALSSVLYVGIVLAQYVQAPIGTGAQAPLLPGILATYTVCLNVFGFAAIALLTGYLAEGLRQADIRLERASHEIEDLQALSRHIIDSLTSGLATTDLSGKILTFNRAAATITGVPEEQALRANAAVVFALPAGFGSLFESPGTHAQLPRVDFPYTRPDGARIQLGLSTALLRTPRGEIGYLLTFQDVTEARRLAREALVQQRLAAVGEMAAGIAHEIRNPLASMAGSMQILRQDLPLTPDQAQLMDIVLRESERLNETIRGFLAYARPQPQAMTTVDVSRLLVETATLLEHSADVSSAHRIAVDVPREAVTLQADEGQVKQIVWNLATNGLRAMASGGCLTLRARPAGDGGGEVTLEVEDEGTGIAAEDLDAIFHPFRTGFARGTGLGLSIVQRIVADHGGRIDVASSRGTGTCVTVRFPVRRASSQSPEGSAPRDLAGARRHSAPVLAEQPAMHPIP